MALIAHAGQDARIVIVSGPCLLCYPPRAGISFNLLWVHADGQNSYLSMCAPVYLPWLDAHLRRRRQQRGCSEGTIALAVAPAATVDAALEEPHSGAMAGSRALAVARRGPQARALGRVQRGRISQRHRRRRALKRELIIDTNSDAVGRPAHATRVQGRSRPAALRRAWR